MELMAPQQESVPAGYKRTEIGVIPEDWEVMKAGDLGTFRGGSGFPLSFQGSPEGEFPFFKVSDMNLIGNEIRMDVANNYVSDGVRKRLQATVFPPNTIVFAKVGAAVFLERKKLLSRSSCLDNNMAGFIPDCTSVDIRFLHYSFLSLSFGSLVSTTALPSLGNGVLRDIKVSLPPTKAEQEAIAKALSDADAWIASLEQLIQKKRQIKQGAMQSLLTGKRRLPGFSGKWEERRLGEIGRCLRGVSYNPTRDLKPYDVERTKRLLRSNNVQESKVITDDLQFVSDDRVAEEQVLRSGDILICMANGSRALVGKAGRFSVEDSFEYTFGAFMGCYRPHGDAADPNFAFRLFGTEEYRAHIDLLLAGSSINNLTPGAVENFALKIPANRSEQTAIATVLSDMDAEIDALETKLAKARHIKEGVMQELLTGRKRLI